MDPIRDSLFFILYCVCFRVSIETHTIVIVLEYGRNELDNRISRVYDFVDLNKKMYKLSNVVADSNSQLLLATSIRQEHKIIV